MPRDSLTLAIWIWRQINMLCLSSGLGDGIHMLAVARNNFILHGKVMLGVNRTRFGQQVTHVAISCQYLKVFTQILFEGNSLGRRLNN